MVQHLPPLNALRAFEAAGRHESFSRAAEELGVSHSAISRHVRGLEQRLKAQLFREAARGVALTEAGQRYLDRISPAFSAISEASEVFSDRPSGVVTLSCEPLFALKFLMPRLARFRAEFPEIEVRPTASTNLADVERFESDMAIRFLKTGRSDLPVQLLSDAPIYPYAAPDAVFDLPRNPRDFLTVPRLKDRSNDTWRAWFLRAGLPEAEIPPPGWRLRSALSMEEALLGQGVILTSAEVVSDPVQKGALVQLSDIGIQDGNYSLLIGEVARRRKSVRLLRDWLLDECAAFRGLHDT